MESIEIKLTENMQNFLNTLPSGMPQSIAEMFFTGLLDMSCVMLELGDMTLEIIPDNGISYKLTVHAKDGIRTNTVNFVPGS